VFVVNSDGTGERQLTRPPAGTVDDQPDWSPDGREIAFERCGGSAPCSVWTVPAAGGEAHKARVRCRLKPICDVSAATWTRDGRLVVHIAQGRDRTHGAVNQIQSSSIVVLEPHNAGQRTIAERTRWTGDTATPAVSPDGLKVVYKRWNSWRTRPRLGQALHVVDIDGTHDHRVTPWELGAGDHPVWSPDSATILFRSFEAEDAKQSDFWTVHADGSGLAQLTHVKPGTLVRSASYSLDGQWIVHATDGVGGNADVFVMRADGTDNRPITRTKLWDSAPDWGPPAP
jgi:TolB protein